MGLFRWFRKRGTEPPGVRDPDSRRRHREPQRRNRRAGRGGRADGRRTEDLYQADLDRHLWALGSRPRRKGRRSSRRRLARVAASAAGMIGAAGLSYWLYRRIRDSGDEAEGSRAGAEDPRQAQGDARD